MSDFVYISIYRSGLDLNEISQRINIESTLKYKHKKGDVFISRITNEKTIHDKDSWIEGIESNKNETAEMCLERLVNMLLTHS